MTKTLIDSLFFNPKDELTQPTAYLKADMVEATINQVKCELTEQIKFNKETIKLHKKAKDVNSEAFAEGVNKGISIALYQMRRLYPDLLWKQLSLKTQEDE